MAIAKSFRAPSQFWLGVFVCVVYVGVVHVGLLFGAGQLHAESVASTLEQGGGCPAQGELQWARIAKVVDGDTLRLVDGRKLRLIAVNAPETARKNQPAQPFASQAKAAVEQFFNRDPRIALQIGLQPNDKYGRVLAHVFNRSGESLAATLLAQGLAWHITVPPNIVYSDCLRSVERVARKQRRGIWADGDQPLDAARLQLTDTGFQRVRGQLLSVERSRDGWWLQLGQLAVRLSERDLPYFGQIDPKDWLGQTVTIRGWVIDRSLRQTPEQHQRYSALMVQLRHPVMIEFDRS